MSITNQDTELKQLPYAVDKKTLMAMYTSSSIPERKIREAINAIIAENRKLPEGTIVNVRNVWHKELMEFVEQFGLPKGYKL